MTTPATDSTFALATSTDDALRSIDIDLLEGIVGGCAACGTPGQPCAPTAQPNGPGAAGGAGAAFGLLAQFARR